jgi:hypothetical protein
MAFPGKDLDDVNVCQEAYLYDLRNKNIQVPITIMSIVKRQISYSADGVFSSTNHIKGRCVGGMTPSPPAHTV